MVAIKLLSCALILKLLMLSSRWKMPVWRRAIAELRCWTFYTRVALNLAMNVFRGMAVQAVLRRDEAYFREMVMTLKTMLAGHVRPASGPL